MAEETIFNEAEGSVDNTSQEQNTEAQSVSLPDEVSGLIGEGKKYANVEEALKALRFSQEHISTIEQENATMRDKLKSAESIQELLNKQQEGAVETPFDISKINEVIDEKLSAREKQSIMTSNIKTVDTNMKKQYGEKAAEILHSRAEQLGFTIDQMMNTAANSPAAFMAWFPQESTQGSASMNSDVNTETSNFDSQNQIKPGTYKYYNQLRRENPSKYLSPQIQKEMHDNCIKMGETFYA